MKRTLQNLYPAMAVFAVLMLTGCADAEFSGNGNKNGAQSETTPNGDTSYPNDGGTTIPNSPLNNGGNNPGGSNGGFNIKDWFGWGGNGFDLEFKKAGVLWHIGDNNYSASNCKLQISIRKFENSTQFNYNFYVEQNNTTLGITVEHCGTDAGFNNTATLYGPQGQIGSPMPLSVSNNLLFMKKQNWNQPITLNQGWYKLKVATSFNQANNDWDDFIVGKVKLVAPTGPIQLGEVTPN